MIITAPSYFGCHNILNYALLIKNLTNNVKNASETNEELLIDCDFLHYPEELIHYFESIFTMVFLAYEYSAPLILIQSKDRKTLRKVKKSLSRIMLKVSETKMRHGKYFFEIV